MGKTEDQKNQHLWLLPVRVLQPRQQCGSTLIEVTAAMMILAVASLSLIELFSCDQIFVSLASQDIAALNRAQDVLEEIKALKNVQRGLASGGDSHWIALDREGMDLSSDYMVALTGGVGAGQVRKIESFDPGSGRAFVYPGWVTSPETGITTYLILRDRPYRDNLRIIAVDSGSDHLQTITVTYVKQVHGEPRETSLTTEKCWW